MRAHRSRRAPRAVAAAVAAASLAVGLAACGDAAGASGVGDGGGADMKIGLLLPENETARYEMFDRPLIERKLKELCPGCTVEYANAHGDPLLQRQQVDSMISRGVDVLILDSVSVVSMRSTVVEARDEGIPVVSYDRLTVAPVSSFTGFREPVVGRLQGQAMLTALGRDAARSTVVWMDGPATRGLRSTRQEAAQAVLKGRVKAIRTFNTSQFDASDADAVMRGAIASLGVDHVNGIVASNDVLAAGAISALQGDHVEPLPPVMGVDGELQAVQHVVSGQQYMTVYKPIKPEADVAAKMAIALGRGEKLDGLVTNTVNIGPYRDIPAFMINPVPVTSADIKDTIIKEGVYTIGQICTPRYRQDCVDAGLLPPTAQPPGT